MEASPCQIINKEWRRSCGCLKTSQKLKQLLKNFPEPTVPPPPVCTPDVYYHFQAHHGAANHSCHEIPKLASRPILCQHMQMTQDSPCPWTDNAKCNMAEQEEYHKKGWCDTWRLVQQVLSLLQLMVTASALAVYYLIYCYMQLIYFALQSAIYFHNADPSMKVTIAVVSVTSIILGINLITRAEKMLGF